MSASLWAASCSDTGKTVSDTQVLATGSYVGRIEGSDARLGVVVGPTTVVAFVCGGDASYQTVTTWLRSPRESTSSSWLGASGNGVEVRLEPSSESDETISASVRLPLTESGAYGSTAHSVTITRASDAIAGVWESTDADGHAGVVVTNSEDAQGAFIPSIAAKILQIVPIRPIAPIAGILRVRIAEKFVDVRRIEPL